MDKILKINTKIVLVPSCYRITSSAPFVLFNQEIEKLCTVFRKIVKIQKKNSIY